MTMSVGELRGRAAGMQEDEGRERVRRAHGEGNAAAAVRRGVDAHIERAVADAVRHRRGGVLYVGMNTSSRAIEAAALGAEVTRVHGRAGATIDTVFGRFDLARDDDAERFARALAEHHGLGAKRADAIACALVGIRAGDADARDEIARIAIAWADPESGTSTAPSRIVLSGHSTGNEMWGDESGMFSIDALRALAKAMPRAAAHVEHIHFAACFSAAQVRRAHEWREAFPNLRSMFGYDGYSPNAPLAHLRAWEHATRAGSPPTPRGTIAWTADGGLADPRSDIAARRAAAREADARFDAYLSGEIIVTDPHERIVEADYATYRALASTAPTAAERADAERRGSLLLRVRFYETSLRSAFARTHGEVIARAYRALGFVDAPDFATLGRLQALAYVAAFRRAAESAPGGAVSEARRLLEALASLDPAFLPAAWCH
jgi:hypothetical protein